VIDILIRHDIVRGTDSTIGEGIASTGNGTSSSTAQSSKRGTNTDNGSHQSQPA
jgi:hypothetical protein